MISTCNAGTSMTVVRWARTVAKQKTTQLEHLRNNTQSPTPPQQLLTYMAGGVVSHRLDYSDRLVVQRRDGGACAKSIDPPLLFVCAPSPRPARNEWTI